MKIRKIAAITLLVLSSFAANSVAPSKTELETMYDKAFREFDANNYEQALTDLEAIDARQPDLAESQNLRGVIFMRQGKYDEAETALQKALASDPKFWNARFNLAEIPFLRKNWTEARERFQALLTGNASELQGEATQLIQYKILLTFLLEGKENMVDSILAKFELSPDTPAVHYANAAVALHNKNEKEAKDWLTAAEKNFSPQLNKLFAESLYEVGWMEKPAGQTRAAIELNSAAERLAKAKAYARTKSGQAEQALQQRDLTAARKLVDEADAADPNQAAILNLRGEILLEQKEYEQAEAEFKKAIKVDAKFRGAQFNLAEVPFKQKEYSKARDRFEALFGASSGAEKDQSAQLIKFKVFMTYLLEGKDSRAQKMMEQFQFTGDTPALYYAQAAWEFKQNNTAKANDWVTSARKIYAPALNLAFADAFYDLGWLQSPGAAIAAAGPASGETAPGELAPSIEPTPIPNESAASLALQQSPAGAVIPGMEATTSTSDETGEGATGPIASLSPSVETPVASASSPAAAQTLTDSPAEDTATETLQPGDVARADAPSDGPATVLAPAQVREWSRPSLSETFERLTNSNTLLVAGLLLGSVVLFAWVVIPELRRRVANGALSRASSPVTSPQFDGLEPVASVEHQLVARNRLMGGPPRISLQLKASEPSLRRAAMPLGKQGRALGAGAAIAPGVSTPVEDFDQGRAQPIAQPEPFSDGVGAVIQHDEYLGEDAKQSDPYGVTSPAIPEMPAEAEPATFDGPSAFAESELEVSSQTAESHAAEGDQWPVHSEVSAAPAEAAAQSAEELPVISEFTLETRPGIAVAPEVIPAFAGMEMEPIGQGQPIPHQTPASIDHPMAEITKPEPETSPLHFAEGLAPAAASAGLGALRHSVENPSFAPKVVSTEPIAQQPTIPATMPQPTPTPTQPTPPPVIRTTPVSGGAPQPGGMHTAVQLTFSFEIASLQLTPTFKMGAMQLKPTSKIVMMRLAPSQHPQPAMNLQVTFEIATVQLAGGAIGTVRLTPSQQQRPGVTSSPSFNISGVQLVAGSESAPVQITPSQQGQASVHVTAGFQIATVEFSPSFEIASIVLNSTSKNVSVQLPGSGPSAVEGAPVFEIANVQLAGSGEIGMMQLNAQGFVPKRA